jgi:DNA-directed RNA polymerase subunit RPC12/RpoP
MTSELIELIKCPHCGYKFRTDVEKVAEDGETVVVRLGFSDIKKAFRRKVPKKLRIDLTCSNCKKEFEWEVKI